MRRTVAFLALLLAALLTATSARAAPSPAPPLTPVTVVPARATAASAAWQDATGTHVLRDDQPLGGETVLPAPVDCRIGGLTAADVAYGCVTDRPNVLRVWLQDRRTSALRPSPIAFGASGAAGEGYELSGVGSALGAIFTSGGPHVDPFTEYRRLTDGRRIPTPRPSAHRVVSLDAPSGTERLCAPLSVGTHRETISDELGEDTYTVSDQALYRAPWLVTVRHARVLLKRCGSRKVRDLGAAYENTILVLTGRYVAWATEPIAASWRVHRLSDHATFHYAPIMEPYAWRVAATDHRLWLGDDQGKAYMIAP